MPSANFPLAFPAKAGTHSSAALKLSSSGNALLIFYGLCPRHDGPRPFAGVAAGWMAEDTFTRCKSAPGRVSTHAPLRGWPVLGIAPCPGRFTMVVGPDLVNESRPS